MENEISSAAPETIRSRVSYREYVELAALLVNDPTVEEIVTWFHQKLDRRYAYGSETNAGYAYEWLCIRVITAVCQGLQYKKENQ